MVEVNPFRKLAEVFMKERLEEKQEECDHKFGRWSETGRFVHHSHPSGDRETIKYQLQRRCVQCGHRETMNWNVGEIEWDWHDPPEWLDLNGRVPQLESASAYDPEQNETLTRDD